MKRSEIEGLLSERVKTLPYSGIREIFDLAAKMPDVIHLEIGDPDFATPNVITEAAFAAARSGMTHYTSSAGIRELREALSINLASELGVEYSPDEIVITAGAMEALLLVMLATVNPGDEIMIPSPSWPNYEAHVLLAQGRPKRLALQRRDDFQLTPEVLKASLSKRTRGLLLNYPHNPTGAIISKEALQEIAQVAIEHNLIIYSDEAYNALIYDGSSFDSIASLPGMRGQTVVIRSFSKTYAMTGWRIGYLAAPLPLANKIARLHEHTSACTNSLAQAAALTALELPVKETREMVRKYERRRNVLLNELAKIPGIKTFTPRGTFYIFVDISSFGMSSFELARYLLTEVRVAVAPGTAFGEEGEGYIRVAFANSEENLKEGVERMKRALAKVKQQNDRRSTPISCNTKRRLPSMIDSETSGIEKALGGRK
jgi:aspartate/methionine/tyrosine aminotransferase